MLEVYPLILACVALVTIGQLCFRMGARGEGGAPATGLRGFLDNLGRPIIWVGLVAFITNFCVWFMVLNKIDLAKAYPLTSLDYVVVTICSSVFLHERVRSRRWIGVAFVVAGVILIGRS